MTEVSPPAHSVKVTVMIFTLNEEVHLARCLDALSWSDDVIVIDSFSADGTREIAKRYGARFVQNRFTGFGDQRNWALDNANAANDWILILDADEIVPPALAQEIALRTTDAPETIGAFRLRRRFYLWSRWLKHASLYPSWVVRLIHRSRVRYRNKGHSETQEVEGVTAELESDLIDENLRGIDDWFARQNRYATEEAAYELAQESSGASLTHLFSSDPLVRRMALKRMARHLPARGLIYFIYSYVLRGGFLDGREGFVFCVMRSIYQDMVWIKKFDLSRKKRAAGVE